jgi:hypothetical protein
LAVSLSLALEAFVAAFLFAEPLFERCIRVSFQPDCSS